MAKTILIIDDSRSLRKVVEIVLTREGYEVVEACDGRDALDRLDGREFHLMICDVNMPNLDGFSFLRAVREMGAYATTPVIMLTSESGEDMKREGQKAGAQAWVVKPFKVEHLLDAVAKLIL